MVQYQRAALAANRRWLDRFDGDQRLWTPSLYLGLIPLLLALPRVRFRRGASAGCSGPRAVLAGSGGRAGQLRRLRSGLVGSSHRAARRRPRPTGREAGDAFGGLYWLMTYVLPGYLQFRYPGKLFTLAALALALLAARGLDDVAAEEDGPGRRRLRRLAAGLGAISLVGAAATLAVRFGCPRA